MSDLSFSWNGSSSDDFGVAVTRLPDVVSAEIRGTTQVVSGRDGTLFLPDGALGEMVMLAECYLPYEQGGQVASMDAIRAWLRGSGWWTQSDVPGRRFRARITDAISFQPLVVGFADRVFGVTLYADPYQYVFPEAENVVMTEAGTIVNPATAASSPRITIEGSGDFSVAIGGCLMDFEGISGGIVVDSDLQECLSLDGAQLLNSQAAMEDFPTLQPGGNAVSWTGDVTRVTIAPRWRYL